MRVHYFSNFPHCSFGARCLYIHPPCRFDRNCANPSCPYTHGRVAAAVIPVAITTAAVLTPQVGVLSLKSFGTIVNTWWLHSGSSAGPHIFCEHSQCSGIYEDFPWVSFQSLRWPFSYSSHSLIDSVSRCLPIPIRYPVSLRSRHVSTATSVEDQTAPSSIQKCVNITILCFTLILRKVTVSFLRYCNSKESDHKFFKAKKLEFGVLHL